MEELFIPRKIPEIINLNLKVTSIYFQGTTYYFSYKELIAILTKERFLHINNHNYSNTTNKHRRELLDYLIKNPQIQMKKYSFEEFQSFLMENFD